MPFDELQTHAYANNFERVPVTFAHTAVVSELQLHHRDPFDRIIIAQAMAENLTILGMDKHFAAYNVQLLW